MSETYDQYEEASGVSLSEFHGSFGPIYRAMTRCGRDLGVNDRMVLMHLMERLGSSKATWPSIETIAASVGLAERTVRTSLATLTGRGFLTSRRRGQGKTNVYTINLRAILDWSKAINAPSKPTEPERHELPDQNDESEPVPFQSGTESRSKAAPEAERSTTSEDPPEKIHHESAAALPRPEWLEAPLPKSLSVETLLAIEADYSRRARPSWVREQINAALNHKAVDKRKSANLYLRNWLNRDLKAAGGEQSPKRREAQPPPPPAAMRSMFGAAAVRSVA